MTRLNFKLGAFAWLILSFIAPMVWAQYPTKTVQIINPFPPGAVTDIVARILAPKMSAALGQQVVIVNKAGGGGAVGIQAAKDATPDGYTILVTPPPIALIPLVNKNSSFTLKDFAPLALATSSPNTTLMAAARKEAPKVSRYEASTRGEVTAAQKASQLMPKVLITSADSGIRTIRLR